MRSLNNAICTSGEPVSRGCVLYCSMTPNLASLNSALPLKRRWPCSYLFFLFDFMSVAHAYCSANKKNSAKRPVQPHDSETTNYGRISQCRHFISPDSLFSLPLNHEGLALIKSASYLPASPAAPP